MAAGVPRGHASPPSDLERRLARPFLGGFLPLGLFPAPPAGDDAPDTEGEDGHGLSGVRPKLLGVWLALGRRGVSSGGAGREASGICRSWGSLSAESAGE